MALDENCRLTLVRDCTTEFRMRADAFAGIFRDTQGRYWVAWGRGYEALSTGDWIDYETAEDGITANSFATLSGAEAYVREVADAHASTDPI